MADEYETRVAYYVKNKEECTVRRPGGYYPQIGAGIVLGDERFRVADTWYSLDKDGQLPDKTLHVVLEPVQKRTDDWPSTVNPDYYTPMPTSRIW